MALWGGRFTQGPDQRFKDFNDSLKFDCAMSLEDIDGSIGCAKAICEAGVLTLEEKDKLIQALNELRQEIADDPHKIAGEADEDIHSYVERRVCLIQDLKDRIFKEFQIDKDAKVIDEKVVQNALTSYWDLEPDDEAYMQWVKRAQMLLRSDNPHLFYGLLTNIYRHFGLETVYYQWGLYYLYQFLQGCYK